MNNIYSLVYQKSEKALQAIDMLSELLRYSLYENQEKVSVAEEVEHVRRFVALNEIRYDYTPAIKMEVSEASGFQQVPPFLLISLMENAFKHGELRDENDPVSLSIQIDQKKLKIEAHNRIREQHKDTVGGIGLENLQKQLHLLYGDNHRFLIQKDVHHYTVRISLPTS